MPRFGKPQRVRVDSLRSDPATAPKSDETLLRLIREAVEGKVPVYLAVIPLARCRQFDLDYGPQKHPAIAAIVAAKMQQIADMSASNGRAPAPSMLVYPSGKWFMVSDDYPSLFAYLQAEWEYVAAVVLGTPEGEGVEIVRGPLSARAAKAAIFGGMVEE
jgi:hypothetical protein